MIFSLGLLYVLVGLLLAFVAVLTALDRAHPRRFTSALFWGLYAAVYLFGDFMAPALAGAIMIAMALLAGCGLVRAGGHGTLDEGTRSASAARLGNRLFLPALVIPIVTVLGATLLKDVHIGELALFDKAHLTLASLGLGALLAVAAACWLTRASPLQGVREAHRLVDAMSWAVTLPHMLAVLGLLFSEAGVGRAVAHVSTAWFDIDSRLAAVCLYCIGMALFTIIMGNGFAAFPVIAGGIGVPLLVRQYGADPAVMAAIGMFSAYCGTLMTPMAANFNIVPAALLELPDKNAVIKAQIPTALPLLAANIVLLYFLMNLS
ncbi:DUF979 domain-containing protein [Massilia sp. Dwa41.01b]|uniref:DUF979 domain-containing protein n=1 Tax=Massilia sp. Dwa41.01b TaxID=2709302 RepID=UPI001600B88A|nr:DUF979 domain-containing protein [Massilia sp. Dwa41.01b]QNA88100.1 DUF979 domain-containing protein [Massilia sp. Dwa41.01b]